jgi:hypothetical protein|nr:MAG TPA: Major capsid protein [Microviridae sp.]
MANGAFDATLDVNNEIKVNNFDWSHANNLTTQIGRVTPVFCELVPAHGSVRISPRFGLQFMPMVFPVQTRLRARMMFFKYPLRALWDGYRDFVGNFREDLEEPYLDLNSETRLDAMAKTGSLGDYLGLPTTLFGNYGTTVSVATSGHLWGLHGNQFNGSDQMQYVSGIPIDSVSNLRVFLSLKPLAVDTPSERLTWTVVRPGTSSSSDVINVVPFIQASSIASPDPITANSRLEFDIPWKRISDPTSSDLAAFSNGAVAGFAKKSADYTLLNFIQAMFKVVDGNRFVKLLFSFPESMYGSVTDGFEFFTFLNLYSAFGRRISGNTTAWGLQTTSIGRTFPGVPEGEQPGSFLVRVSDFDLSGSGAQAHYYLTSDKPVDLTLSSSPYYNSNSANKDKQIKISAYSFRAYEGIYNAYIRDNRNNPYYVNGQVQYNKWIPTSDGGADQNIYELRYANWEKDFLTTAVQSPQQGTSPLVGITTYTETVETTSDDGTLVTRELSRVALVDEDGKKYQVSFDSDSEGLKGVSYVELDNEVKLRQPRNLIDVVTSGISINDLRNVNAYQKFLELNMRKGYSYRDIIEGRFNVKVRYDELLMPEFFGGFSRDIEMHSISQTVDQDLEGSQTYAKALGSQSGIAGVRGSSERALECFCDEESIVMGIMIVTPLPVYTQLLPKHFTYRGLLDHYQPEFNHIGFQPILYKEVCPLQAYREGPNALHDVFGYNRPWYEYVQKYDQAHGLFRTNLSNFLMHRVFDRKPQLAQSFLVIDPAQVTDVFAVTKADDGTELTDKIYGQIWFDCTAKLPISRVAIPRLD